MNMNQILINVGLLSVSHVFTSFFSFTHHRLYWAPNATRPHSVAARRLAANVPLPELGIFISGKGYIKGVHHKIS